MKELKQIKYNQDRRMEYIYDNGKIIINGKVIEESGHIVNKYQKIVIESKMKDVELIID